MCSSTCMLTLMIMHTQCLPNTMHTYTHIGHSCLNISYAEIHPGTDRIRKFPKILAKMGICLKLPCSIYSGVTMYVYIYIYTYVFSTCIHMKCQHVFSDPFLVRSDASHIGTPGTRLQLRQRVSGESPAEFRGPVPRDIGAVLWTMASVSNRGETSPRGY